MPKTVKILVEITIDECTWEDEFLNPGELERFMTTSMRNGERGLSVALWEMGIYHDFEVKKVTRVVGEEI